MNGEYPLNPSAGIYNPTGISIDNDSILKPSYPNHQPHRPNSDSILNKLPILDISHPDVAGVLALQNREERDKSQRYYIDGLRFVYQALEQKVPVHSIIVSPELMNNHAREMALSLMGNNLPAYRICKELFYEITNRETSNGIAAVVSQCWQPLDMAVPATGLCWIAIDSVRSPGNLGTVIRTSEAVDAAGVILLGDSVDPYDPGCVRGTMGAIFRQRFVRTTFDNLYHWTRRHNAMIVGTSPHARINYDAVSYNRPTILFLGSERTGISIEMQRACDKTVRIPMTGRGDSLNLGVAAGVMLYEIFNQRQKMIDRHNTKVRYKFRKT